MLELLIRKGANLDCQNVDGWTPLHVALVCQYKECVMCVRILIQHGCNINLQVNYSLKLKKKNLNNV